MPKPEWMLKRESMLKNKGKEKEEEKPPPEPEPEPEKADEGNKSGSDKSGSNKSGSNKSGSAASSKKSSNASSRSNSTIEEKSAKSGSSRSSRSSNKSSTNESATSRSSRSRSRSSKGSRSSRSSRSSKSSKSSRSRSRSSSKSSRSSRSSRSSSKSSKGSKSSKSSRSSRSSRSKTSRSSRSRSRSSTSRRSSSRSSKSSRSSRSSRSKSSRSSRSSTRRSSRSSTRRSSRSSSRSGSNKSSTARSGSNKSGSATSRRSSGSNKSPTSAARSASTGAASNKSSVREESVSERQLDEQPSEEEVAAPTDRGPAEDGVLNFDSSRRPRLQSGEEVSTDDDEDYYSEESLVEEVVSGDDDEVVADDSADGNDPIYYAEVPAIPAQAYPSSDLSTDSFSFSTIETTEDNKPGKKSLFKAPFLNGATPAGRTGDTSEESIIFDPLPWDKNEILVFDPMKNNPHGGKNMLDAAEERAKWRERGIPDLPDDYDANTPYFRPSDSPSQPPTAPVTPSPSPSPPQEQQHQQPRQLPLPLPKRTSSRRLKKKASSKRKTKRSKKDPSDESTELQANGFARAEEPSESSPAWQDEPDLELGEGPNDPYFENAAAAAVPPPDETTYETPNAAPEAASPTPHDEFADDNPFPPPPDDTVKQRGVADDDSDKRNKTTSCRKLGTWDYVLIALGLLVILILVIVLPLVIQQRDRGGIEPIETGAPTAVPLQPSPAPVQTPPTAATLAPTEIGDVSEMAVFYGASGSEMGTSVSMASNLAAAGAPLTGTTGSVATYLLEPDSTGQERWVRLPEQTGEQENSRYGTSVSVTSFGLVVGAPGQFAPGTQAATGAAYFYQYRETLRIWQQLGSPLIGILDGASVDQEMGYAVASCNILRVAIGAPRRNLGNGAVYTFEYGQPPSGTGGVDWYTMTSEPLTITDLGGELGRAVAMNSAGSRVLTGAPATNGQRGKAALFEWDEAGRQWFQIFEVAGNTAGDLLGVSVAFLSDDGSTFAIGVPGSTNGGVLQAGRVDVYRQIPGSLQFQQLGLSVVSDPGDDFGVQVAGGTSSDGLAVLSLLVATSNGVVRRFLYNPETETWEPTSDNGVGTGGSEPVTGLGTNSGASRFISGVATTDRVTMYSVNTGSDISGPTAAPSASSLASWARSGPTFPMDSNLVTSVALSRTVMAAGAGGAIGDGGLVKTRLTVGSEVVALPDLRGRQAGDLFGTSVHLNQIDSSLLVGAPASFAAGTTTATGVAYMYRLGTGTSFSWEPVGGEIRGEEDPFAAGETFGFAVSSSDSNVVAVGAPGSNAGNLAQRGRVYTYVYDTILNAWVSRQAGATILGEASGDLLGWSVDISRDGTTLAAGGPGHASRAGYAVIYRWDGAAWNSAATIEGGTALEGLGTCVKVLSNSIVALGGPGYDSNRGIIRVYQLDATSGNYIPLGPPIHGEPGDTLGGTGSLGGSNLSLMASTAGGAVKAYTYQPESSTWRTSVRTVNTGFLTMPVLSGSEALDRFVVGSQNDVQMYSLVEAGT